MDRIYLQSEYPRIRNHAPLGTKLSSHQITMIGTSSKGLPILMYHKIGPCPAGALVPHHYVSGNRFQRQVKALVQFGFQTVHLNNLSQVTKPIVLTFDDGYENFASHAVPALQKYGQTATVFLVASLLGKTNEWDTAIGDKPEPLMDTSTVQNLAQQGFEFGSHSMTHVRLAEVNQNIALEQIRDSRSLLEEVLAQPVETFCYPYGSHNEQVRQQVKDSGYKLACSVEKGWNQKSTDPYRLRRINVRSDTSTPILFWKLWRQSRIALDPT